MRRVRRQPAALRAPHLHQRPEQYGESLDQLKRQPVEAQAACALQRERADLASGVAERESGDAGRTRGLRELGVRQGHHRVRFALGRIDHRFALIERFAHSIERGAQEVGMAIELRRV